MIKAPKKSTALSVDKNAAVTGTKTENVTEQLAIRPIDRSPKDRGTLRAAHIVAESISYPNQSRLFDTYEDALLDGHLTGILRKRKSQVVNKKLLFLRDGQPVPEMEKVIKTKAFKNIMREIIETTYWGINALEFIPGKKIAFNKIPKKHIKRKTQLITFEQTDLDDGIDYTKLQNVWVLGEPRDLGLLLICSYIVMLKKGVIADWAQYIELFGSPAIVLKYKGYDQQAKIAADKILKNIGNSMRITIPEEMGLTFEDGKISNGDGGLQETARKAFNEELDITILGNTETTGAGKNGTGAKSQTHSEQQLEIIKDDMDDICDALNSDQFMDILRSYNLPVDGGEFCFDREVDIPALERKIKIDIQLLNIGLPIAKKYLYETYGIPEPKSGEPVIQLTPITPSISEDEEEEEETGEEDETATPKKKTPAKPKPKAKPKLAAVNMNDISAMLDQKLRDFFGQPS